MMMQTHFHYHVLLKEYRCKSVTDVRDHIPIEAIELFPPASRDLNPLYSVQKNGSTVPSSCVELVTGKNVISPSWSLPPPNKTVAMVFNH